MVCAIMVLLEVGVDFLPKLVLYFGVFGKDIEDTRYARAESMQVVSSSPGMMIHKDCIPYGLVSCKYEHTDGQ